MAAVINRNCVLFIPIGVLYIGDSYNHFIALQALAPNATITKNQLNLESTP